MRPPAPNTHAHRDWNDVSRLIICYDFFFSASIHRGVSDYVIDYHKHEHAYARIHAPQVDLINRLEVGFD